MRELILDTETTGLDPQLGHRVIELAGLEVINRRVTGRYVHFHVDPEREIDFAATEIHGKTWDDLKGKPKFRDIAAEFAELARGAQWVIHNAPFDIAFLDRELQLAGLPGCAELHAGVIDTLALARDLYPGKRNSLDALCERFSVDNTSRTLHGALLDTQLLAEVYLAMTRGQESLTIDIAATPLLAAAASGAGDSGVALAAIPLKVIAPTAAEAAAHRDYLAALDKESRGRCVWLHQAAEDAEPVAA
jgi:DNA polymerase-3 subunit epsilon